MYHIKVYNAIAHEALERLDANAFAITDADPQGILLRSYNLRQETLPDSLLAIARAGAGTNNIPVEECAGKGIVVFNTPGANSNAVKELVIASMIIAARNLVSASRWAQTLQGDIEKQTEAGKKQFRGQELTGKTIGIAGMGAIGSRLARDCVSLGLGVMAARAAFYAKEIAPEFLHEGRAYGPHGEGLWIANSLTDYDDARSKALTEAAKTANLTIRAHGKKPFYGPSLSSGAYTLLAWLRGEWFYGSIALKDIYFGCRVRQKDGYLQIEHQTVPGALDRRLEETVHILRQVQI
jgi:hypothetical protein